VARRIDRKISIVEVAFERGYSTEQIDWLVADMNHALYLEVDG
jgi:hypothetical protein